MITRAKWLQSATMMAFLAVVALLVSPALALACCCHNAPPAIHSTVIEQRASCHDAGGVAAAPDAKQIANCAAVRANCECETVFANATFVASDNARFFAPLAVTLPAQKPLISFVADARRAAYAHFAARPRLPDRILFSGRAPPALALS